MKEDESSIAEGTDVIERGVAIGQKDEVSEEYPPLEIEQSVEKKGGSKVRVKRSKVMRNISKTTRDSASVRITELAQPLRRRAFSTLQEKASTLPPAFVDNLIKMIEADSCLTPEEVGLVDLRRKERYAKKTTRFAPLATKWMKKGIKSDTRRATTLDRDAILCQYSLAERFVKSILNWQCQHEKKDFRDIAGVISKRLLSLDRRENVRNNDGAMQPSCLLADTVACWVIEILAEVAEAREKSLKEYCDRRRQKMLDVDEDDDSRTTSETERYNRIEERKSGKEKKADIEETKEESQEKNSEEEEREENQPTERQSEEETEKEE